MKKYNITQVVLSNTQETAPDAEKLYNVTVKCSTTDRTLNYYNYTYSRVIKLLSDRDGDNLVELDTIRRLFAKGLIVNVVNPGFKTTTDALEKTAYILVIRHKVTTNIKDVLFANVLNIADTLRTYVDRLHGVAYTLAEPPAGSDMELWAFDACYEGRLVDTPAWIKDRLGDDALCIQTGANISAFKYDDVQSISWPATEAQAENFFDQDTDEPQDEISGELWSDKEETQDDMGAENFTEGLE